MTQFDYAAGAVLLASGVIGFARGATREVVTVLAFVAAAVIAVFGLRVTGPYAHQLIHTLWLAHVAAILALFIAAYIVLRLFGGALTQGVRQTPLSGLDRIIGFGFGLVRGLVVIGLFVLLIQAATPAERMPVWLTRAALFPLGSAAGKALHTFAPKGFAAAKDMAPAIEHAVVAPDADEAPAPAPRHKATRAHGYSDTQRQALDDLVEKSR